MTCVCGYVAASVQELAEHIDTALADEFNHQES